MLEVIQRSSEYLTTKGVVVVSDFHGGWLEISPTVDGSPPSLLSEHGQMARGFPDVRANTVAAFALGDYEWLLAFEADELYRIVDLMRHLRGSETRRHVRLEIPFYTGRRRSVTELVDGLP